MKTFLSPHFVPLVVTRDDLIIASIALGFTLGFGFLTTCKLIPTIASIVSDAMLKGMQSNRLWPSIDDMERRELLLCMCG